MDDRMRSNGQSGEIDDVDCTPKLMDWNGRFLFIQSLLQHFMAEIEKKTDTQKVSHRDTWSRNVMSVHTRCCSSAIGVLWM